MRHAVLVMTHGNTDVLEKCMTILDSSDIDFYIHIDKKSSGDFSYLIKQCRSSHVFFTKRIAVYWGDYSLIEAELLLLETAIRGNYDYYHLISGSDLPLKTPKEFCLFFEAPENKGLEFIKPFTTSESFDRNQSRVVMSYPFVRLIKQNNSKFIIQLQKLLFSRVLRFDKPQRNNIGNQLGWSVYCGEEWFSISNSFAKYLLENRKRIIKRFFRNGYAADEAFVLTILKNSFFADKLSKSQTRLIDWKRGTPYFWQMNDKDELLSSQCLFARKFNKNIDAGIVDAIYSELIARKQR